MVRTCSNVKTPPLASFRLHVLCSTSVLKSGFISGRDPKWMGQLANSSKNGENVSMTPWNDVGVSEK